MKNKLKFVIPFLLLGVLVLIGAGCQKGAEEGAPSGEKTPGLGWSIETVDNGSPEVGNRSIALDSKGHPHISYVKDLGGGMLCYAHWTGSSWDTQTVESPAFGYPSIALDSSGHPHISYLHGEFNLRYAHWTGSSWDIQTVGQAVDPVTSIALNSKGHPHISYYGPGGIAEHDGLPIAALKYARWTGSSWDTQTVDTDVPMMPFGLRISIAIDGSDHPHISYVKYKGGETQFLPPTPVLCYAHRTGSSWDTQTVDSGGDNSIALDSSGRPHISYCGPGPDNIYSNVLKYARWTGSSWDIQTVDDADGFAGVGLHNSLALDSNNHPHISYYFETPQDLKYAHWNGTSWQTETVDGSTGSVGWYTSIVLDSADNPHISYYDFVKKDLKYAKPISE